MTEPGFDPAAILAVLARHRIQPGPAGRRAARPWRRRPRRRTPAGLPFDTSAEALRGVRMLNLRTVHGDLDLTFAPAGFPAGYDLIGRASRHVVNGIAVRVAALTDIIASKTEAGRQKDLLALPELRRLAANASNGDADSGPG